MNSCDVHFCRDIQRLWKTAEQRYAADGSAAQAAIGPSYSQWQDFPDDVGQASAHHCGQNGIACVALACVNESRQGESCLCAGLPLYCCS